MRNHRWCIIGLLVLLLLWLGAEWKRWQLNLETGRVYVRDTIIKVVDADTKEPLQLKLGTAGLKLGEHWPKLAVVGTGKPSELEVRWAAPGPVAVRVSSAGYEEQQLTLDRDSEHRIVVPLQRLERPVEHVEHP